MLVEEGDGQECFEGHEDLALADERIPLSEARVGDDVLIEDQSSDEEPEHGEDEVAPEVLEALAPLHEENPVTRSANNHAAFFG